MANRRTEQELLIQALKRAWLDHPELRLGEMVWVIADDAYDDIYTILDDNLLAGLRNRDCCRETKSNHNPEGNTE